MRRLWKVFSGLVALCMLLWAFCLRTTGQQGQLQNNSLMIVNPPGGTANNNVVPSEVYNTPSGTQNTTQHITMVASANVVQQNYRFTYYITQLDTGSGCSGPTIMPMLQYKDVNTSSATITFPTFNLVTTGSFPFGLENSETFMFQAAPGTSGADIILTTVVGGCPSGTFPHYEIFPVLESM